MIWVYRQRGRGVEKRLLSYKSRARGQPRPDDHFSQTLLKAYYEQECQHGSRFRSGYSKNQIRRVHDTALQRFEQLGQDH